MKNKKTKPSKNIDIQRNSNKQAICKDCKGDIFKVYVQVSMDDAELICAGCGKEWDQ